MGILLQKAGWQTLVMDQGRRNTRDLGIPVSGVTDLFQYWWACGLVGHHNFSGAGPVVLEIRSGSVEILFDQAHSIALTGSPDAFYLDGVKINSHTLYQTNKGQKLHIRSIRRNGTVYLALAGQWDVTRYYGSAAADILSPFPGTAGRILQNGDYISITPTDYLSSMHTPEYIKNAPWKAGQILRIIAGPELHASGNIKKTLHENAFIISRQSNRMGYRLDTSSDLYLNLHQNQGNEIPSMVSSIVLPGIIQWPSAIQPILLLPNCQTTGGYPRVAKVIDADMWKLAYVGPGDELRFKWTTREEAIYLRKYELGQFERVWNQTFSEKITNHILQY